MKIPENAIEKAVAEDSDLRRWDIHHLLLEAGKGRLVATDGHMIVISPVDVAPGEKSGAIPAAALRRFREGPGKFKPTLELKDGAAVLRRKEAKAGRRDGGPGTSTFSRPKITFPTYGATIPRRAGSPTLVLNRRLLLTLIEALKDAQEGENDALAFWVPYHRDESVLVGLYMERRDPNNKRPFAAIMQMRSEADGADLTGWYFAQEKGRKAGAEKKG